MTDTKESELTAESRLVSDLIHAGILVAKPYFDQMGGDLLGFIAVDPRGFICRIQSKYRDCSKRSLVDIPAQYIEKAFLLYLHLIVGGQVHQAFLLPDDIRKRFASAKARNNDVYRLTLTPKKAAELGSDPELQLTSEKVKSIMSLMRSSSALAELYTSSLKFLEQGQELIECFKKKERLQSLLHQAKIATIQMQAAEEHLATTQELKSLLESQLTSPPRAVEA